VQTAEVGAENNARVHTFGIGTCAKNEAELIKRVLEGCNEAFADLLRPHVKAVRSFVRKTVRNDFDVDDQVQQTLLKAYTRLHQFRFESSFRTWLISIARNEIRQNARLRCTSRLVFDEGKSASVIASYSKDSPFEIYARKEMSQQLWQAIANLPAKYRLIVELLIREKSLAETKSELSIPSGTAKSLRFRARRELCRLLTKSGETRSSSSGLSCNPIWNSAGPTDIVEEYLAAVADQDLIRNHIWNGPRIISHEPRPEERCGS
jgi:RNA polymerase sigma factor (sigma-70 family)